MEHSEGGVVASASRGWRGRARSQEATFREGGVVGLFSGQTVPEPFPGPPELTGEEALRTSKSTAYAASGDEQVASLPRRQP